MKARDIMVPITIGLRPEERIESFVSKIREARTEEAMYGIRALPVLNASGMLVGILSMFDILKVMHPSALGDTDLHSLSWDEMLETLAKKVRGKKVADLMTVPVRAVREDHSLMECVDHMLKFRISSIPVVGRDDKLIGMLYESDIFFALAQALKKAKLCLVS